MISVSNSALGLVLGLPIAFGLASVNSVVAWKASAHALPPNDQDVQKGEEKTVEELLRITAEEEEEKKKKEKAERRMGIKVVLGLYATIAVVVAIVTRLPSFCQDLYMVACMSLPAVSVVLTRGTTCHC